MTLRLAVAFLPLILRSLLRSRRRLVLTLLSVGLSLCLVATLQGLQEAMDHVMESSDSANRIAVRHRAATTQLLPIRYEDWIRLQPGVDSVMAMQWFGGIYQDRGQGFANYASEPEFFLRVWAGWVRQVPAGQYQDFMADLNGCVVGQALADRFGWHLGTVVPLQGTVFPFSPRLTIRCIFQGRKRADEMVLHFHYRLLERNVPELTGRAAVLWVRARRPEDVPALTDRIDRYFRDAADPTRSETESAYRLQYLQMLGDYRLLIHTLSGAVLVAVLLVTSGTMAMQTRERAGEIAVLRAIGFTRGQILGLLLAEGVLLLLVGGLLGLGLASLAAAWIRLGLGSVHPMLLDFQLPGDAWWLCLQASAGLGLLATFLPAYRASRRPVAAGLRAP